MDEVVYGFVVLLRAHGVRVSPAEVIDALRALTGVPIGERELVKSVLRATLVKDGRHDTLFDELFELYFGLRGLWEQEHEHEHEHEEEEAATEPERITLSEEPAELEEGHSHEAPANIRDFFDPKDLVTRFNLDKDSSSLALSAVSDELHLSSLKGPGDQAQLRHQLQVERLRNAGMPGDLVLEQRGEFIEADLVVASADELPGELADMQLDAEVLERLRSQLGGVIDRLPELLRRYLQQLAQRERDRHVHAQPAHTVFSEEERRRMEELLRRLGRRMRGALSHRRQVAARGRINPVRTMRSNLRYGGVPFRPVLSRKKEERPRLVILADVSLSVRHTSRFALHLVHSLQNLFSHVRTFVFVADLSEVTEHFDQCGPEEALALVLGGKVLDVDVNSNYGRALEIFHQNHLGTINRRTTVLILGDGRGNGNPPNAWVLEEIRRRSRQLIWLTPEPRGTWYIGGSDMPLYAELCHRVEVVRDLEQLERVTEEMVLEAVS